MRAHEIIFETSNRSDLVDEFLKTRSPKELAFCRRRDNCGPAAIDMMFWAKAQGIDLQRVQGYFVADSVVYAKADFTKEMRQELTQQGLDFNNPLDRKNFIEANYSDEWRKIPHYWLTDRQGKIYDPTGELQFIRTGLAKNLNPSRYLATRVD